MSSFLCQGDRGPFPILSFCRVGVFSFYENLLTEDVQVYFLIKVKGTRFLYEDRSSNLTTLQNRVRREAIGSRGLGRGWDV